jgi:serine/threonine-protein kinase
MGIVYAAEHVRLEKPVAVKVLAKAYSPGSVAEKRFVREARAAGSLGHPNIVQVFDLGTLPDGSPFLAMERLEGVTLADRIGSDGAIDIDEATSIAEQVLSALSAAHARGVVHRDVKPENVFLTRGGGVKLLDFGISKNLTDVASTLTQAGVVVGTPYYLAPEQARAEHLVDPRTDLWGVGATLYESLTGRVPFKAKGLSALLVSILEDELKGPSTYRPRISAELDAVVLCAMRKEQDDRYPDADSMLHALRQVSSHRTGIGPDPTLTSDLGDEISIVVDAGSSPPGGHGVSDTQTTLTLDDPTEVTDRDETELG